MSVSNALLGGTLIDGTADPVVCADALLDALSPLSALIMSVMELIVTSTQYESAK